MKEIKEEWIEETLKVLTTVDWHVVSMEEMLDATEPRVLFEAVKRLPWGGLVKDNLTRYAKRRLIEVYMNARVTRATCGGHGKAERNETICLEFEEYMKANSVPVPSDGVCFVLGNFNGRGSS